MSLRRWIAASAASGLGAAALFAMDRVVRRPLAVIEEPDRAVPYWIDSISDLPRFRPVDEHISVDVAIVGGGFSGLAIAYYLKKMRPDLRVALLEARRLGSGASSRNSGGAPSTFRGRGSTEESVRGYQLLRRFCVDNALNVDLSENVPSLTLHHTATTAIDPVLTGDELRRAINSPYYEAAVAGVSNRLHPGKLIAGLIAANQDAGVELYEHSPVTRVQAGSPVWLHTPGGRIIAEQVALATNGYTAGLGYAGDRIMTLHHRVIATRPLTDSEWDASGLEEHPYRLEHGTFFTHTVRRTPDRRLIYRHVLGHRAFERSGWEITASDVAHGQRELLRRYPWLEGIPIDYEWHGVTARTRDLWPVAGRIDENVFVSAGFNGNGIMASHYFGYLLAHAMLGIQHQDLQMLRPPDEHPSFPGELARSLATSAWMKYSRLRD